MHESNHNLLFRNKCLNRWTGFVCGLPSLVSVTAYRTLHLAHHADTGTHKDPDNMENAAPKALPMVLFFYLFRFIGAYLYLGHLVKTSLTARGREKPAKDPGRLCADSGHLHRVVLALPFRVVPNVWLIPAHLREDVCG